VKKLRLINTAIHRGEFKHVILLNGFNRLLWETVETVKMSWGYVYHPAKAGC